MMVIIVFSLYVIVLLGIGIYSTKKTVPTDEDYFIGSRKSKFVQVGLSAGATGNSGFIMTGAVGLGYVYGVDWIFLPIAWFLGDLIYWKYFPQKLNKLSKEQKIITPTKIAFSNKKYITIISILILISLGAYAISQLVASSISLKGYFHITFHSGIIMYPFGNEHLVYA